VGDASLGSTMPGITNNTEVGFWPRAVQVPGAAHGAGHVVAALHNHRGDVADTVEVPQELAFVLEEAAVEEVMALDARHRERVLVLRPHGEGAFVQ